MKKYWRKKGLPPGSLVHIGDEKTDEVSVRTIKYNNENFIKDDEVTFNKLNLFEEDYIAWTDIIGVHNTEFMEKLNNTIKIHSLTLEDIMNTEQRIKIEDFGEYLFTVLKMINYDPEQKELDIEQVSLVSGDNYLISFQEKKGDVFETVRNRIYQKQGKIRGMKGDYLLYSLIDAIVDNYFIIMEYYDEELNVLEEQILAEEGSLEDIHRLKSQLLTLHRIIFPFKNEIYNLLKNESKHISPPTMLYFRDIYDHLAKIYEQIDSYREKMNNFLDVFLSINSNKMNEVMKILTIIATIFMPLTLLAGIYGMNFEYMPELDYVWAYPAVLLIMVVIAIIMIIYFKRKKMM